MEDLFLPATVNELIELLDTSFPDKCPNITESERQIFFKAGQRSVVEWLKDLKQRTEEQQLSQLME